MGASWAAGAVAALLLTALTGCGDGASSGAADPPSQTPSSTTSTPSSTSPAGVDSCPYLTAEEVTDALGAPTHLTAGSVHACFFDPEGGDDASGPSVMLSRVDVEIDPADYARQTRQLCQGEVTDVEAGDQAFACVMGLGPQGQLYAGSVLVTVSVNDAADDATGLADAAALLPQVTIPPSTG